MEYRSAIPKIRRMVWFVLADDLGAIEVKSTALLPGVVSYSNDIIPPIILIIFERLIEKNRILLFCSRRIKILNVEF